MAKPRLKVYRARMGFAEAVVAAPSQKAALQAWGARQNLFAEGLADVTEDPASVQAAAARPGVVLQRPIGSEAAFTEQLVGRPTPPAASPQPPKPNPTAKAVESKPKPKTKPKPDRSALTAAETALSAIERQAKAALADLDRRRKLFETEAARLERDFSARRTDARQKVDAERRAFDAASGED